MGWNRLSYLTSTFVSRNVVFACCFTMTWFVPQIRLQKRHPVFDASEHTKFPKLVVVAVPPDNKIYF